MPAALSRVRAHDDRSAHTLVCNRDRKAASHNKWFDRFRPPNVGMESVVVGP